MPHQSEVSAADFAEMIESADAVLNGLIVVGSVHVRGTTIRAGVWAGCRFLGGLFLDDCKATGNLFLTDCFVDGPLSISGLDFDEGGIRIASCRVLGDVRLRNITGPKGIFERPASVIKGVKQEEEYFSTGLVFSENAISGSVSFSGFSFAPGSDAIYLSDTSISGHCRVGADFKTLSAVIAPGLTVGRDLNLVLTSDDEEIGPHLDLSYLNCGRNLEITTVGSAVLKVCDGHKANITGSVSLHSAGAAFGLLHFDGATVGGQFEITGPGFPTGSATHFCKVVSLNLASSSITSGVVARIAFSPKELSRTLLRLDQSRIAGNVDLGFRVLNPPTSVLDLLATVPSSALVTAAFCEVEGNFLVDCETGVPDWPNSLDGSLENLFVLASSDDCERIPAANSPLSLDFRRGRCRALAVDGAALSTSVDLTEAQITDVALSNCILGQLRLDRLRSQSLSVRKSWLAHGATCVKLTVDAEMVLDEVRSWGQFDVAFGRIGKLLISRSKFDALIVANSRIDNLVSLTGTQCSSSGTHKMGLLDLHGTSVGGDVLLSGCDLQSLVCNNTKLAGSFIANTPTIDDKQINYFLDALIERHLALTPGWAARRGLADDQAHMFLKMYAHSKFVDRTKSDMGLFELFHEFGASMHLTRIEFKDLHALIYKMRHLSNRSSGSVRYDDVLINTVVRIEMCGLQSINLQLSGFLFQVLMLYRLGGCPIDARGAVILGDAVLRAASFPMPSEGPEGDRAALIDMSDASIERVTLDAALPRPIRLARAKIGTWDTLTSDSEPQEFIKLLECVEGFEPHLYRDIERNFAENGKLLEADAIFFHWRKRSRQQRVQRLTAKVSDTRFLHRMRVALVPLRPRLFFEWLNEVLFGYGIRMGRWMALAAVLFISTFGLVAWQYEKVLTINDHTLASLADAAGQPTYKFALDSDSEVEAGVSTAEENDWLRQRAVALQPTAEASVGKRLTNSLFIAISNHLPMLGLDPLPGLAPKGDLFVFMPTATWLQLMRIFNWLLLPILFAIGLARFLPKRYENM